MMIKLEGKMVEEQNVLISKEQDYKNGYREYIKDMLEGDHEVTEIEDFET